eukprot:1278640-Pyramimonas_sp.AAC.1
MSGPRLDLPRVSSRPTLRPDMAGMSGKMGGSTGDGGSLRGSKGGMRCRNEFEPQRPHRVLTTTIPKRV